MKAHRSPTVSGQTGGESNKAMGGRIRAKRVKVQHKCFLEVLSLQNQLNVYLPTCICLVDDSLDMSSMIYDSILVRAIKRVFFWVKTLSTYYQGAVFH